MALESGLAHASATTVDGLINCTICNCWHLDVMLRGHLRLSSGHRVPYTLIFRYRSFFGVVGLGLKGMRLHVERLFTSLVNSTTTFFYASVTD
jgi:hypothetical protein